MKIYHNPRCRKSREALTLMQEKGIEPEVILYLQNLPSEKQLAEVIQQLGIKPIELIRKGESEFKDNFKGKELSDSQWIKAMIQYPKLIERPIVIKGSKAVVARPAENLLKLL